MQIDSQVSTGIYLHVPRQSKTHWVPRRDAAARPAELSCRTGRNGYAGRHTGLDPGTQNPEEPGRAGSPDFLMGGRQPVHCTFLSLLSSPSIFWARHPDSRPLILLCLPDDIIGRISIWEEEPGQEPSAVGPWFCCSWHPSHTAAIPKQRLQSSSSLRELKKVS